MKSSKHQTPSSNPESVRGAEASKFKLQTARYDAAPRSPLPAPRVLIAGIGNIFMGDDAFGCEVIGALSDEQLPRNVQATDFGIRSYDLAYALLEEYEAIILADAVSQGARPGTLFLIEPEIGSVGGGRASIDPHTMNAVSVLQMAQQLGGIKARVYLVGCEPQKLESEEGALGLSEEVQAAIPRAVEMIESLLKDLSQSEQTRSDCAVRA